MRKIVMVLATLWTAVLLTACGSGSEPRTEPFVGQWESTGGQQIAMRVDAPTDGGYPVQITGENVDLALTATAGGEGVYEATSTTAVWTFRLVDDELLNATVAPEQGAAATTSFTRVGE